MWRAGISALCFTLALAVWGPSAFAANQVPRRLIPPVPGEVARPYLLHENRFSAGSHRGIDFEVAEGTRVRASASGTVKFAGPIASEGLFITVAHDGGIETTYSYLKEASVVANQAVAQGAAIGLSGPGHPGLGIPSLHFGTRRNGLYFDPSWLLRGLDDITDLLTLQQVEVLDQGTNGNVGSQPATIGGPVGTPETTGTPFQTDEVLTPLGGGRQGGGKQGSLATTDGQPIPSNELGGTAESDNQAVPQIPTSRNPEAIGRWWAELTADQRQRVIVVLPKEIGELVGVPLTFRNQANRLALDDRIKDLIIARDLLDLEIAGLRVVDRPSAVNRAVIYGEALRNAIARRAQIKKQLDSANHLSKQLDSVDDSTIDAIGEEDVLLLEFDTAFANADGRAVVALGNPDRADYVGVVVPGIMNRLGNVGGTIDKAAALHGQVFRRGGAGTAKRTSTIAWLGYDTPESVFDALDRAEAKAGAARLKTFTESLRVTHSRPAEGGSQDDSGFLLSVFGHSYGSSASALAASLGSVMDNLVLVGSPGAIGQNAGDLVGADKVWAGRSWDDFIRFSTGFAALGDDPTNWNFGATKVPMCCKRLGHGDYFLPGTRSLSNLAKILTGDYEELA